MSGLAIKVSNVDWNKNNLGSVNYGSDNGNNINRITTVSEKAYAIYEDYITKSERPDSQCLLLLINDLVKEGLEQKCKGLYYLSSKYQNINHIKYSVIGNYNLDSYADPMISVNGIQANENVSLFDHYEYDLGNVDSNLCLVFMMSQASTRGIEWGGEQYENYVHSFVSAGNASYLEGVIFRWGKGNDKIELVEDNQKNDGVYVIHINKNKLVYKHKGKTINKTLSEQSKSKFCPRLMNYRTINDPSKGTMKFYATFSREDLTASDINKIHEIFTKYEHLL
ncbi:MULTISPECIES: hypothetical protein [unclassified Gilliamella]|uniref:hypothetical protein n=1 Tax=unclassified Gilliamella TaxID=2685620 RepID=UPI00226A3DA7|nr:MULTISPECIES: hypothetical protein [unclassified Gilliamella]MCX8641281.1 hypothetical protein [Gilliamella sp. B3835]MCX8706960.1 hypothetical protein [Gilliamella sp. B3783]MCX8709791.1 hypothetical protein [Gilliamella sp. B3780]MCX8714136.1 hypothetical protein [Gilliamella sp. B3781]MCX8715943.1 hypothetical protein [Gilliamella sp. B3784]